MLISYLLSILILSSINCLFSYYQYIYQISTTPLHCYALSSIQYQSNSELQSNTVIYGSHYNKMITIFRMSIFLYGSLIYSAHCPLLYNISRIPSCYDTKILILLLSLVVRNTRICRGI